MNFKVLDSLAKVYGTPFYLMNSDIYLKNIKDFQDAFLQRYNKLIIGYSFKTNYVPALCKIAKEAGCYAEVVSEMEYELAEKMGFDNIIFNGPIKKRGILGKAISNKSIVNIDSQYEIDSVIEYKKEHAGEDVCIGLRLNIDLTDNDGISMVQCGLRVSRFGFSKEMLAKIIPLLKKNDIKIISLHGHTSSSNRAVINYQLITEQMLHVCEYYGLNDLEYFDVGGGFFGAAADGIDTSSKPRYIDYANCIINECVKNKWFKKTSPWIVIEPGVSVVANVFSYVSKIFQSKDIAGQKILTTDGTVYDVKPTLHSNNLPYQLYTKETSKENYVGNLVGSTCMEKDIILQDIVIPQCTAYGDYVQINGVGAYTITLTPTFINFLSPIIELKKDSVCVIRRRQTIDDVLAYYTI